MRRMPASKMAPRGLALPADFYTSQPGQGTNTNTNYVPPVDLQQPRFEALPCRAVYQIIKRYGWNSPEHLAAKTKADEALVLYLQGKDCPDPLYRPSPQMRVAFRRELEIGIGGAKGGAKTFLLPLWMTWGNPWLPYMQPMPDGSSQFVPHRLSFLHHPSFIGLILRRNFKDMSEIIAKSIDIFSKFGGGYDASDYEYKFPGGAVVGFGHMADKDSYKKYFGRNIIKLAIDELIQLKELETYEALRSCVRSVFPEMPEQILVTFNPRGGEGVQWVYDYFIEPKMRDPKQKGALIPILGSDGFPIQTYTPDGKAIYPEPVAKIPIDKSIWERLGVDAPAEELRKTERIFIPALISDNPYLMDNHRYTASLSQMDEDDREAYLFGKWSTAGGAYFPGFRPQHIHGEPDNAVHVVKGFGTTHQPGGRIYMSDAAQEIDQYVLADPERVANPISYWWDRSIGGDWGFDHEAVFIWGAENPTTRQVNCFHERAFSETLPEVAGFEVGRDSAAQLRAHPRHQMTLWIGGDTEQNRMGEHRVVIELIAQGIGQAIGPKAVHMPDYVAAKLARESRKNTYDLDTNELGDPNEDPQPIDYLDPESIRQAELHRASGIIIRRALSDLVMGWQLCRSLMRWAPIVPFQPNAFNADEALGVLFSPHGDGPNRFAAYMSEMSRRKLEALPRLQIWNNCVRLIAAIPRARRDTKRQEIVDRAHFRGKDVLDAWRYLIMGMNQFSRPAVEPIGIAIEREFEQAVGNARSRGQQMDINNMIRTRAAIEQEVVQSRSAKGTPGVPVSNIYGMQAGGPGRVQAHQQRIRQMLLGKIAGAGMTGDWRLS